MLRFLILIALTFIATSTAFTQVSITVDVPDGGGFSAAFLNTGGDTATVTNLTVTGNIDARDIKFMRDHLPVLATLDLEHVQIDSYLGNAGTSDFTTRYPANQMPDYSFCALVKISEVLSQYKGKESLVKITFPQSITSIGDWALHGCEGLSGSLIIPNSVVSIRDGAFSGCSGFTGNLIIPTSVTTIGYQTFAKCTGFTGELIIPATVKTIDGGAFQRCSGFTGDLKIPYSITMIEAAVFEYCTGITGTLALSNSLTSISGNAFYYSENFTGDIIIPEKVTRIDHDAFLGCSGFNGILSIPNSVNAIIDGAFKGCSSLKKIIINKETPITIYEYAVYLIDKTNCELIVPTGAKAAYQTATGWGLFENITEAVFVTLDTQGEYPVAPITTPQTNSTIPEPPTPEREGYSFEGWYQEASCINKWNFATDVVMEPITLYARWSEDATDIRDEVNSTINLFSLKQNYPNPFNPKTMIEYEIQKFSDVQLVIYNNLGRKVKTLINEQLSSGRYCSQWDGTNDRNEKVSSGVYFYQLKVNNEMQTKRVLLIK